MTLDDLTTLKSPIDNGVPDEVFNNQSKKHPSSISPLYEKPIHLNSSTDENLNDIFALTTQKLQPTLNALQDKKDEILSASKNSPNSSIKSEYPRKSILRNTQSNSTSQLKSNVLWAAIKQRQELTYKIIQSPKTDWIETAVNYGIDSGLQSKSNEVSLIAIDDKSISAIERSYSLLPLSTAAVRNFN